MPIIDLLLPEFDQEMANTRKMLAAAPEDKFNYRPHEKSWSLGQLATHVSNIPTWIADTFQKDELDIQPPGQPPYKEAERTSVKQVLDAFDSAVAKGRESLKGATDEKLMQTWSLPSSRRATRCPTNQRGHPSRIGTPRGPGVQGTCANLLMSSPDVPPKRAASSWSCTER